MAAFFDLMTIANDPAFQNRIQYALEVAAENVMAEAGNVTGHAQRVGFSTHVLNGSVSIHEVTIAVMTNSTIAGEADITKNLAVPSYAIPDSDIQFTINSLYSILAGVAAN